jgi:hypothetical protein
MGAIMEGVGWERYSVVRVSRRGEKGGEKEGLWGGLLEDFGVSGEGEEGPGVTVHVVFEVEDFGEAGAGGFEFGPGAVGVLGAEEVMETVEEAGTGRIVEGAEAHDGPSGLGRRAGAAAFEDWIVVGIAAFAPAAVVVLDAFEPVASAEEPGLMHVEVERAETAENLPGAVDVIDAPATVPGAVTFLLGADIIDGFLELGIMERPVFVAEQFEDAGGDIGAFGIEHGVVVGEGDFFEDIFSAVFIEGAPSAVAALERHHPIDSTLEGLIALSGRVGRDLSKCEEHHGGVVYVGVPFIFELEGPAAGFDWGGVFIAPIAAETDFLVEEPGAGLFKGWVVGWDAGFAEAHGDDGGIPDWGKAGFDPEGIGGMVFEVFEFLFGAEDTGVMVGVAEGFESDEGIEHAWEDGAEAVGAFHAFEHPLFGFAEGPFAEGTEAIIFDEFMEAIEPEEEVAPGDALGVRRESEVTFVVTFGEEFVEGDGRAERACRFEVVDDGEGDEHGAGP